MIGLNIRVKNVSDRFLYKLFNGVDLSKYTWKISADNIMYNENGEHMQEFFGCDTVSGEDFKKCISRDSYYMIFADFKAYPVGSNQQDIETYTDYLQSDCQMIILCTDSVFIDFYCKDNEILDKVHKNSLDNNFEQVYAITKENDTRTRMSVW